MNSAASVTVRTPIKLNYRRGRALVVVSGQSSAWTPARRRVDSTLVKALDRAHRWKRRLDDGIHASISELAAAEKPDRGDLGRILMLTVLAPDIVEAITDGRQPTGPDVRALREGFAVEWVEQRKALRDQPA